MDMGKEQDTGPTPGDRQETHERGRGGTGSRGSGTGGKGTQPSSGKGGKK